jgi:pyruvate dehydrogenase E1 component alpha subunit
MSSDIALKLYRNMYRIRAVEEEIARRYPEGKMRCPVHLSIGQEAVPAAFAESVRATDFAVSTHRGHAHYLAKGGNLGAMLAEIYGKATGCAKGKGGSMHLIDLGVNFMGTSAIVGNSIPIGVGLALSAQLKGTNQISCVFLGDGAIEEGVFYESVNFAAVKKLPVLFICENNLYSVYSPLSVRHPKGRSIAKMVEAMGAQIAEGDGNDALAAHQIMQDAVDQVRAGDGPYFLEFSTYRWREHCGPNYDNDIGYRTQQEFQDWHSREPISRMESALHQTDPVVMDKMRAAVNEEVQAAFEHAEAALFPAQSDAYQGVYA